MNGHRILAWILIVLQVIGVIKTLLNGGSLLFDVSFDVFLVDLSVALGYYAPGVVGVALLCIEKYGTTHGFIRNNKEKKAQK